MGVRWMIRRRPVERAVVGRRRVLRAAAWCVAALAVVGGVTAAAMGSPAHARALPRIVGGAPVQSGAFPFMVAVQQWQGNSYLTICGGTLIAPDRVLTAAHCVNQWTVNGPLKERLVVGRTVLSNNDGQVRLPAAITVDNVWDPATEVDDAAVIRLDSPVTGVVPPYLPASGDRGRETPGSVALALGWGSTQAQAPTDFGPGVYPDGLRQVALPIVADSPCQQVFDGIRNPAVYPDVMLCAGGDGSHDACTGDSGGPLLTQLADGSWELIGITSWGDGCAVPGMPGVFTRLSDPDINAFVVRAAGGSAARP